MVTEIIAGPLGEIRSVATADGGTSVNTTASFIQFFPGTYYLEMIPRNFSTAVVLKYALSPFLVILRTQDDLATVTDASNNAQDHDTATSVTLSSQDTAANGDYLFVGANIPFRGVDIDVDSTNSSASVLTVKYWDGSAWTSITATDGTASGGASLAQDGQVTWTVPTAWTRASLETINSPAPGGAVALRRVELYWTRWEWSAALDSSVTLDHMLAMNRSTSYAELPRGVSKEMRVQTFSPEGIGCLEVVTDAGTLNLIVNVATQRQSQFV